MEVREPSARYLAKAEHACLPGYKQTEVGVIPEDWSAEMLGPLVEIRSGESPSLFFFGDGGTPYFKVEQLNNGNKYLGDTPYRIKSDRKVPGGSLIFPKRGASILLNKIRLLAADSFMDTNLMTLTPRESVNREYLYYAITHIELWRFADVTSIPQINNKHIIPLVVPLPPLTEQQAIAEALSDADALIESLDQLLAKKRQIKQGAMQELLTGQKRLPGFSGEWAEKAMGALFDFSGGYSASRDQLGTEGHCYLHYGDIHTSDKIYVDLTAEYQELPKLDVPLKKVGAGSLLRDGDVVFVDASEDDEGTSKHVVVANPDNVPFISGLHTIVARSKDSELVNLYKRFCFQTRAVKSQFRFFAVGTKVSGVSKSNIGKITVMVPPEDEQTAIATVLSDLDAEIAALEARLAKARLLKQGMMQELLTGRIRLV